MVSCPLPNLSWVCLAGRFFGYLITKEAMARHLTKESSGAAHEILVDTSIDEKGYCINNLHDAAGYSSARNVTGLLQLSHCCTRERQCFWSSKKGTPCMETDQLHTSRNWKNCLFMRFCTSCLGKGAPLHASGCQYDSSSACSWSSERDAPGPWNATTFRSVASEKTPIASKKFPTHKCKQRSSIWNKKLPTVSKKLHPLDFSLDIEISWLHAFKFWKYMS